MNRFAVIVAGGSGQRFGSSVPKQFLLLKGKPVLVHSIEKFSSYCNQIVVVLPQAFFHEWEKISGQFQSVVSCQLATGGSTRSISVYNGLAKIKEQGWVAIHDAARPLVSESLIDKVFSMAEKNGNAVPCIPLNDSLRQINAHENKAVNRNEYRLVQTPQCFALSDLKNAFHQFPDQEFSDEASLMERAGFPIHLIDGEYQNFKITSKADLSHAETLISHKDV